jgi:hypothetical protein
MQESASLRTRIRSLMILAAALYLLSFLYLCSTCNLGVADLPLGASGHHA